MKIGINVTNLADMVVHRDLINSGLVDFVELLIDNMIHLDPHDIRKHLGDVPVAFHIMNSSYLTKNEAELVDLGSVIRKLCNPLRPIYVSDHIARFSVNHRRMPTTLECFYEKEESLLLEKIARWQSILDSTVYFENFPSTFLGFGDQPKFFKKILDQGSGILFDISNAWVAQTNTKCPLDDWLELVSHTNHFHIGGFRLESSGQAFIAVDTHDTEIDQNCLIGAAPFKPFVAKNNATIVVERDSNIDFESWMNDLKQLKKWAAPF